MFSLDDRAGNVVTTVTLFLVMLTVVYVARGAFFILLLSFLFAYLLEPAVAWVLFKAMRRARSLRVTSSWFRVSERDTGALPIGSTIGKSALTSRRTVLLKIHFPVSHSGS